MAYGFTSLLAAVGMPAAPVLIPVLGRPMILALCAVAAVATWLMLPGRREVTFNRIGAAILFAVALVFGALLFRHAAAAGPKEAMGPFFWLFSFTALASSVRVITHKRPIYSALYFVLTVFATAGLFVLLWAEFIAAALVLIYAGAILITYVFVIMLASEAATGAVGSANEHLSDHDAHSRSPFLGAVAGFGTLAALLVAIFGSTTEPVNQGAAAERVYASYPVSGKAEDEVFKRAEAYSGSAQALGKNLIDENPLNLQLSAIILTLAMVGAITLSRRKIIVAQADQVPKSIETVIGPNTPIDDDPHSIPVYGTTNPRQKAYPEN